MLYSHEKFCAWQTNSVASEFAPGAAEINAVHSASAVEITAVILPVR